MGVRRQVLRNGELLVQFSDASDIALTKADMMNVEDTTTLRLAAQTKTGRPLPASRENQIHLHKNRDGTFELICGDLPKSFLEDQKDNP